MKNLSDRTKALLLTGANTCGNFTDGFNYIEKSLYVNEVIEMSEFCEWIDKNVGGAGRANINNLYYAFKNPKDVEFQNYVKDLAEKIQGYRKI